MSCYTCIFININVIIFSFWYLEKCRTGCEIYLSHFLLKMPLAYKWENTAKCNIYYPLGMMPSFCVEKVQLFINSLHNDNDIYSISFVRIIIFIEDGMINNCFMFVAWILIIINDSVNAKHCLNFSDVSKLNKALKNYTFSFLYKRK